MRAASMCIRGALAPDLFRERVSSDTRMEYPAGSDEEWSPFDQRRDEAFVCLTEFLINLN
jgi:hypothetical protein